VATYLAFGLAGVAMATWAGRIPSVRSGLDLTPGQLGLLLLVGSAGSLLGLPLAGRVAGRFGAARTVAAGALLLLAGLAGVGVAVTVAHSVPWAAAMLFIVCFGMGQWDVAMNLHGAEVERGLGRTIMPRYHAAFSLGTVASALISAGLAGLAVPVGVHFAVASVLLLGATWLAVRAFLPHGQGAHPTELEPAVLAHASEPALAQPGRPTRAARSAWLEPRTLLVGRVVLIAAFTEGTANDWLSVAFVDGHDLPEWAGILGLATFLTFMTVGRVVGTVLLDRFGRVPVLRATLAMAAVGSLLMVFGSTPLAFLGSAVWGFGVSLGFPVGMSAAADDPQRAAARVSVVSTIGYLAFLAGPPVLGFLGDHFGVLRALSAVSLMIVIALLALPAMRKPS
jgi:MFS family permease